MRAVLLPLMSCHKYSPVHACTTPCLYLYSLCAHCQALVAYSRHIVLKVLHCHRFPDAWRTAIKPGQRTSLRQSCSLSCQSARTASRCALTAARSRSVFSRATRAMCMCDVSTAWSSANASSAALASFTF